MDNSIWAPINYIYNEAKTWVKGIIRDLEEYAQAQPSKPAITPPAAPAEDDGWGVLDGMGQVAKASIASDVRITGCGGDLGNSPTVNQMYDGGINVTPDASDGGTMELSAPQVFTVSGPTEKFTNYSLDPIDVELYGKNLGKVPYVYVIIESDPTQFDPDLPCVDGMINTSTDSVNGEYLFKADDPGNRIPVALSTFHFSDSELQSIDPGAHMIGAVCEDKEYSGNPNATSQAVLIPKRYYEKNGLLQVKFSFGLTFLAANFEPECSYDLPIRVKVIASDTPIPGAVEEAR